MGRLNSRSLYSFRVSSTHCRHSGIARSGWSRSHIGWFLPVLVLTELEHWKGDTWPSRSAH